MGGDGDDVGLGFSLIEVYIVIKIQFPYES